MPGFQAYAAISVRFPDNLEISFSPWECSSWASPPFHTGKAKGGLGTLAGSCRSFLLSNWSIAGEDISGRWIWLACLSPWQVYSCPIASSFPNRCRDRAKEKCVRADFRCLCRRLIAEPSRAILYSNMNRVATSEMPRTESRSARLTVWDYVFRALALASTLLFVALAWDLLAHPDAPQFSTPP